MSEAQLARIGTLGVLNEWPAIYFAKAFNAAIGEATAPPPRRPRLPWRHRVTQRQATNTGEARTRMLVFVVV